jgi:uncharacterized membrane protein YdfJ with MMPL/SSD domain
LGHFAYRWRGRIVLAAMVLAVAAAIGGSSVFDAVKPFGFQDPASDSSRATAVLEDSTGESPLPDVELLVRPPAGGRGAVYAASASAKRELEKVPGVVRVVTPRQDAALLSDDERAGIVTGYLAADVDDISGVGKAIAERFASSGDVTAGGAAVTAHQLNQTTEDDLRRIELFAAPILFLLSFLVFRGLVAAALPLVVGALSIVTTLVLLRLLTNVMEIDVFVINIVTGLGLGLAIDYSLFVVTRFREALAEGSATGKAVRDTVGSTGRMIVFSGLTVATALASLCVFPQRFLYSIGVGGAIVALTSALVCLTVLPALLAMLGSRVNSLAPGSLQERPADRRWYELGHFVQRHPVAITGIVIVSMVVISLPFLRVELTRANARVLPAESSAHRVERTIGKRFMADPASLIIVVVEDRATPRALGRARRQLARTKGVARVGSPVRLGDGVTQVDAQLTVQPFSDRALDTVDVARGIDWGGPALVDGPPAELADQRQSLKDHLPLAIAIIVVSTLLLLFAMTRAVALPFLALLMNALTVGVAFGVLVLVFQDGRFQDLLGYRSQSALDTSMPILLFAVVFGLSTDYGVFLLQRISEQRGPTVSEPEAIARGMARSGRPITMAALLFAVAMGAFAFSDLVFIKEIAIGTALAVLVDATIVRAFLFPALLCLLGQRAWWAPRWLGGGRQGPEGHSEVLSG